jgi:hypothetical protein
MKCGLGHLTRAYLQKIYAGSGLNVGVRVEGFKDAAFSQLKMRELPQER